MRLVTFADEGLHRPGAVRGDEVVDLSPVAPTLLALVEGGDELLARARELADEAEAAAPLAAVRLCAPISNASRHLYCVGWNYPRHYDEGVGKRAGQETDELTLPTFFTKAPGTVIGPGDEIAWDAAITERLDYEGELAVVLGRGGRSIRREDAFEHVFGYTLANDISARDVQRRHGGQWLKGKGMDTYCPLGPVLVTADEHPDLGALRLVCRVNGEVRQEALIGTMIFPIDLLIAELSLGMSLSAGDIILTGTPPGVGFAMEPQVFLQPGDRVEVEIEEIGTLSNQVAELSLNTPTP